MLDGYVMVLALICAGIAWLRDREDTSSVADATASPQGEAQE